MHSGTQQQNRSRFNRMVHMHRNLQHGFGMQLIGVQDHRVVLSRTNNLFVDGNGLAHIYSPGLLNSLRSTYSMIFEAMSTPVAPSMPSKPGEEFTSMTKGPRLD